MNEISSLGVFDLPELDMRSMSQAKVPDLQLRVEAIWLRALGPKLRGVAGAHILQRSVGLRRIMRLLKELQEEIGVAIPITTFLQLGTVDALVSAIERQEWPETSPFVLMKDGDDRPPLYIVAAASGLVLELCTLARAIDYPGKIWGLQPPGLDGEAAPFDRLEHVAQYYYASIVARQPVGPYHIVGYSVGGLIALEMGRQFAQTKAELGLLALIDSNVAEKFWPKSQWVLSIVKRCIKRVADVRGLPPRQAIAHITTRAAKLFAYALQKRRGETAASVARSAYYIGGLNPALQKVRDNTITAFEAYNPQRVDLKATLFKSELGDPHACDPVPVWRRVVRSLDVTLIPGSHTTMIRPPYVNKLAAEIVARL